MRPRLNCLLVAAWLWIRSRGRSAIWMRRSEGKRGRIPHLGIFRERGRELIVVDYIPRRRKSSLADAGQSPLVFDGLYRVRRYTLTAVGTADTLRAAAESLRQVR